MYPHQNLRKNKWRRNLYPRWNCPASLNLPNLLTIIWSCLDGLRCLIIRKSGNKETAYASLQFLRLMKRVKLSFEFIPSCCFQWRLQQALHALIDLIKWTFSPLAVLMHKPAVCRQTLSYLTRSTRVFAYLYFTEWSTFQVPHRASQPTLRRSLWGTDSLTISRHSCGCSERHRRSSKHYDSHLFRVCPHQQWRIVPHTVIGRHTHLL